METLTKHEEMQTPQEEYEKSVQNLPSLEAGVEMPRGEMPSIASLCAVRVFRNSNLSKGKVCFYPSVWLMSSEAKLHCFSCASVATK